MSDGIEIGCTLVNLFLHSAKYISAFANAEVNIFNHPKISKNEVYSIPAMHKRLDKKILKHPGQISVTGTFYPGIRLSSGWWNRQVKSQKTEIVWKDDLKFWLYRGFEQWAPSWDISFSGLHDNKPTYFGQIGDGDEADSLPVVIPQKKAMQVLEFINDYNKKGQMAFQVQIQGLLCHREHLPNDLKEKDKTILLNWGEKFDYCIILNEEDNAHGINLIGKADIYSGYLWQCWGPEIDEPKINDVYFVWEHTDFSCKSAIKYNTESLQFKIKNIVERPNVKKKGNLVLYQKSDYRLPGDPKFSINTFYDKILS